MDKKDIFQVFHSHYLEMMTLFDMLPETHDFIQSANFLRTSILHFKEGIMNPSLVLPLPDNYVIEEDDGEEKINAVTLN